MRNKNNGFSKHGSSRTIGSKEEATCRIPGLKNAHEPWPARLRYGGREGKFYRYVDKEGWASHKNVCWKLCIAIQELMEIIFEPQDGVFRYESKGGPENGAARSIKETKWKPLSMQRQRSPPSGPQAKRRKDMPTVDDEDE